MVDHTSLKAWQTAHAAARGAYSLSNAHWTPAGAEAFAQLRRAALSVQLNIAEGYPWRPRPEWRHHLRIALGSAMETIDALHFMLDVGAAPKEKLFLLIDQAERSTMLLRGLLK